MHTSAIGMYTKNNEFVCHVLYVVLFGRSYMIVVLFIFINLNKLIWEKLRSKNDSCT